MGENTLIPSDYYSVAGYVDKLNNMPHNMQAGKRFSKSPEFIFQVETCTAMICKYKYIKPVTVDVDNSSTVYFPELILSEVIATVANN